MNTQASECHTRAVSPCAILQQPVGMRAGDRGGFLGRELAERISVEVDLRAGDLATEETF